MTRPLYRMLAPILPNDQHIVPTIKLNLADPTQETPEIRTYLDHVAQKMEVSLVSGPDKLMYSELDELMEAIEVTVDSGVEDDDYNG